MSTQRTTPQRSSITLLLSGPRSSHGVQLLQHAASLSALAVALGACSGTRSPTPAPPTPRTLVASCVIAAAEPSAGDTLSLATMAPIARAHVPVATNAAERLVFAQVYETLIDVDCDRRARPGLAASWTLDATRTRITLTLRAGARFSSGKPVTSDDVLAAWRATAALSRTSRRLARAIVAGTTSIDDHTLIVSLPDTAWLVLADNTLAVYDARSANEWPDGSGPYRIASSGDAPFGALVLAPLAPASDPHLITRPVPNGGARDAIDAGADVLVTEDPVAVGYAAARANLAAVPLPWTRTYALAAPGAAPKIVHMLGRADSASAMLRPSLARDAVHGEARAAQPPAWWDAVRACSAALDSIPATRAADGRSNRIVYRRDDAVARGLTERLVALDPSTVAAALAPNDFTRALRDGGFLAYVLDLPRMSLSPCDDFAELRTAAPWLGHGADTTLVPLVDTRETAIVNRNRVSATVDWRGTLHFGSVGNRP